MLLTEKRNNPSDRFEYIYEQGGTTGVTPLLNADGSVVTTQLEGTW